MGLDLRVFYNIRWKRRICHFKHSEGVSATKSTTSPQSTATEATTATEPAATEPTATEPTATEPTAA
jgi:hypothetical protein